MPRRPRELDILAVTAAGGGLGSLARYGVTRLHPVEPGAFPWATFLENLTGAFLLALLVTILIDVLPPTRLLRPFLGVGVLGSYTTFSALAVESAVLVKDGYVTLGVGYPCASVAAGLFAAFLGTVVAGLVPTERARI